MNKELKYCKNPEDLECNENVKHKTKEYIKKYMQKFGAVYKPKEDTELEWLLGQGGRMGGQVRQTLGRGNPVGLSVPPLSALCYWWHITLGNSTLKMSTEGHKNELHLQVIT